MSPIKGLWVVLIVIRLPDLSTTLADLPLKPMIAATLLVT
jgi:hypothetical protein